MPITRKDSTCEDKTRKGRQAALKAWETIRQRQLEETRKKHRKLTEFTNVQAIMDIKHPEMITPEVETEPYWSGNGIVTLFHKTPPEIACGKFWELRWAYGCPLDCSYCYLRGATKGNMRPRYLKVEHVTAALDEAFQKIKVPSIFNSGELSDSLMNPPIMAQICDKFEEQNKHKILLLSKFGPKNVGFLLEKRRRQVICAWSINAPVVARRWERAAPKPEDRIEAASLVREAGYDTRVRIDPIFPVKDWRPHYEDLLQQIVLLKPTRIILGTPRGLWKTIKYAKEAGADMSWTQFFKEASGWGKKLNFNQRKEIYQFFFDRLESMGYPLSKVTMCKETIDMWKAMGLSYVPLTCNCYGKDAFEP
jgi:spore photoproduct lyase